MTKRIGVRQHYERCFEDFLRRQEVLYLSIDETKQPKYDGRGIKNFDFIVSSFNGKFLIEIKGKTFPYISASRINLWENWIKKSDISGLKLWANHFNAFTPLLVFPYQIASSKYINEIKDNSDIVAFDGRTYGIVAIELAAYYTNAKSRSSSWDAINVSRKLFSELVRPVSYFIPELKKDW